MLHAREDYNQRIQDSANLIPPDEPVFLLRGHDPQLPLILLNYLYDLKSRKHDPRVIKALENHLEVIMSWQKTHVTKMPDIPEDVPIIGDSTFPRRDTKGNIIPWAKEHDYFMGFDPENPDIPTD